MPTLDEARAVSVSVVIPVYAGETTLPALIEELAAYHDEARTPAGRRSTRT